MIKIYFDVSSLCRPFDDQNYARIRIETDAVNIILSKIKDKSLLLIKSPVHYKEIDSISNDFERIELIELLDKYATQPKYNIKAVKTRTEELIDLNFGIADAAHVAFSEYFNSNFISCDDKLLNKCQKYISEIKCINPVVFIEMENLK